LTDYQITREFNTEPTQQRIAVTLQYGAAMKMDCKLYERAVVTIVNCWGAVGRRQSNPKCWWQCCQMSRTNSCCLLHWVWNCPRDAM